ncbi:response regulator [candidate division KSB1 bacterium]|nr:response regulator [candidate division KSB1 bacterium]RQW03497.1 MAG: response regulator [candidate division KSB1 bacterium]
MRIVWIDDDVYRTELLRENLEELYACQISFFQKYSDGIQMLQNSHAKIDAVMLDIMMPPGELFDPHDVDDGRITGLRLYEIIRKYYSGPIILYSNFRDRTTINFYVKNDSYVKYLKKPALAEDILQKIFEAKRGDDFNWDD